MIRNGVAKELGDVTRLTAGLAGGAYPAFVYGGPVKGVPVFTYHKVEPTAFEAHLAFLQRNGYRTLTADEYFEIISGQRASDGKAVLLTFDDGWSSVWSFGLPLLKRYRAKIVLFLAAGRIEEGPAGPTSEQAREASVLRARERSHTPFVTWDEVRALHASGLVDIQSHSLAHSQVFCSPRAVDFVSPPLLRRLSATQLPEWNGSGNGHASLGRPLYDAAPRLAECRRYVDDPQVRADCERYVAERGGERFFEQAGWRRELSSWLESRRALSDEGRFETDEERKAALWRELHGSKTLIESRLQGHAVRHFVFPWDVASEQAIALSGKAGYATVFLARVGRRQMAVRLGAPARVSRLGADFLLTLPGIGRQSVLGPLAIKVKRSLGLTKGRP